MAEIMSEYFGQQGAFYALHSDIMGTRFEMIIYDSRQTELEALWSDIVGLLESWHKMLNRFDAESEVSRINSYADTEYHTISAELELLLAECRRYWMATECLFDVTRCDMRLVEFGNGQIRFLREGVTLDFGGFAKGYALLRIRQMLQACGVRCAIADFGHSTIMTLGSHPEGGDWTISLPSPYDGREVAQFALRGHTLSTSGNTPSYAGHIITPQSGESMCDRALSCVVAENPLDAEVLSTVQMIATAEQMARITERIDIVTAKRYELL